MICHKSLKRRLSIPASLVACVFITACDTGAPQESLTTSGQSVTTASRTSELIDILKNEGSDKNKVIDAAIELGDMGADAKSAVPYLTPYLSDDEEPESETRQVQTSVSDSVMMALAQIGPEAKDAIPAIQEQLKAQDTEKSAGAALTLLEIDPSAAVLLDTLNSRDPQTRGSASFALGFVRESDQNVVNKLLTIASDQNESIEVRQKAATSLLLLKQDVEWFYVENNLGNIYEEWTRCPRRESEVQAKEDLFFDPLENECSGVGRGGGARAWWSWITGKK